MELGTAYMSGRLTVSLRGELDQHEARETMRALEDLLEEQLPRELVLDLSGLTFMDSSGVALLIRTSRLVRELGGKIWIEDPAPQPKRVIEAAGIGRSIPVAVRSR
ncbi:MAG: STAS domain-containing protein [Oscillospiraceae bacterium]|nr:STAS domain-containing protein [Oscillospiraceae bacterium]